jgi:2-keto-3-deoxy-L-rhamnonate aldolase RhmA
LKAQRRFASQRSGAGVTPIAQVSSRDPHDATRILDCGAQGVMVPHVSTVGEASAVVESCRYPPLGHRSASGSGPALGYAARSQAEINTYLNEETLLIAMLETPEAIGNADAIAAVDGIDVLHIGSTDLSTEMGIAGQYQHAWMRGAYETTARAARSHGKWMGWAGFARISTFRNGCCSSACISDRKLGCRLYPERRAGRCPAHSRCPAKVVPVRRAGNGGGGRIISIKSAAEE